MDSLYILGDIHFSAMQPWRLPAGDLFLDWLEEVKVEPHSKLIIVGDLTDDSVNPGEVVLQLERLGKIIRKKFDWSYLLVGNHDLKLYKGKPQLAFEFLGAKDGITILRDPAEVLTIAGLKILSMPHYNYRQDIPPMNDYYANLPEDIASQKYNLIIGHFADASSDEVFAHKVPLKYLNTDLVCLGHIHSRYNDRYIGSVMPCKVSEEETRLPRAMWKVNLSNGGVSKEEILLPSFLHFDTIEYPNRMLSDPKRITVWTVTGAPNETIARTLYKNYFVRSVITSALKRKKTDIATSSEDFIVSDPSEIFSEYIKIAKTPVSRDAAKLTRELLQPSIKKATS